MSLSIASCLKTIFCDKPNIPNVDWVAFENGTFFAVPREDKNKEQLSELGRSLLESNGPAIAGTPTADFSVSRMDVLFTEPVYVVEYDCEGLVFGTVVITEEGVSDIQVGLEGRSRRSMDHQNPVVIATSKD